MTPEHRTLSSFDPFTDARVQNLVRMALDEDLAGIGDVTSQALLPKASASTHMVARESCVVAGLPIAERVFLTVDPSLRVERLVEDATLVDPGTPLLLVSGAAAGILSAERTALNFVQRLSGIATLTRRYVEKVEDLGTRILDTRKTTPGWRALEKYAVRCGGGSNHRIGLYDQVLIKDNHLAHWRRAGADLPAAVRAVRQAAPGLLVEVEADTLAQVRSLLEARPDWILLDNMTFPELTAAVELCRGICKTEASGGITLDTLRGVAETGVDAISVGALTHSVRAVDIALDTPQ